MSVSRNRTRPVLLRVDGTTRAVSHTTFDACKAAVGGFVAPVRLPNGDGKSVV